MGSCSSSTFTLIVGAAVVLFRGHVLLIVIVLTGFIIDQDTMQVYALLYAGGRDANGIDRTIANFIPDAFKAMKVKLVQ